MFLNLAEEVGFEPTDAFTSSLFKSATLNRSAIPPKVYSLYFVVKERKDHHPMVPSRSL